MEVKNESNKKRAYNLIINDILRGEFKDESVLNERRLIERYAIGKTPIREALVELCSEKVLRSIPRYGYEVLPLTRQDVDDIIQFRCLLECGCLRQLAPVVSRDTLQAFRDFTDAEYEKLAAPDADVWAAWESNVRVHLRLMSYGGNRYNCEMLARSMGILKRAYAQFYWDQSRGVKREFGSDLHQALAGALLAGDTDTAAERLKEDICSFEKLIFAY